MNKYLFYFILAAVFAVSLYIRLSNIAMTQTRLFVEFWYMWLGAGIVVVLDYIFLGRSL